MDNCDKGRQKGTRGYNMRELQTPDLAIRGVGKIIFFSTILYLRYKAMVL
jgi:hypothetical protein